MEKSEEEDFVIENGVLKKYNGNGTKVVVPEGVTEIAEKVFELRDDIKTIELPNTVKKIGNMAFSNCDNLQSIILPSSVNESSRSCFMPCYGDGFSGNKKLVIKVPKSKLNDYKKFWKGCIAKTVKIQAGK